LNQERFRMTKQRRVILEEVRRVRNHPTADEVYRSVRRRLPHVSLGTVYRNLDVLVRMGLIRALHFGYRSMRFDGTPEQHYHVRCRMCGRLDDLPDLPLDGVVRKAGELSGYDVGECRVELVGTCPACAARKSCAAEN
jgi:Fur family ferric uptake transcriptional regulator